MTLLLFTIGLKLDIRTLLRAEVWASSRVHIVGSTLFFAATLFVFKALGLSLAKDLNAPVMLLLGFALSFSSTVFAVKVLEERSEPGSIYGRVAVGVLVMHDVFAVIIPIASTGKLPSLWALGLVLLWPAAKLMRLMLDRVGHGDLQVLYGACLALVVGYGLFEVVDVKGDLGALPDWATVVLVLVLKSALYDGVLSRFGLRARTNVLSTLTLTNFSEFGLIFAALAVSSGWLSPQWLVAISLAVAASFVIAAPLNAASETLYAGLKGPLDPLQAKTLLAAVQPIAVAPSPAASSPSWPAPRKWPCCASWVHTRCSMSTTRPGQRLLTMRSPA